jgi:putative adhesin
MTATRWRTWAAVLLGVLLFAGPAAAATSASRQGDDAFEWSKVIAAGKEIEIKGVNGDIKASRATGREVEVKARKSWKRSDPADVTIEVIEHEDGVTICAKYPAGYGRENVCAPGDKGSMNTHDNDVRVDFDVRVPAGVRLVARTVNGAIDADGLQSPVEAWTVNGSVHVTTSVYASAETVNGSITAAMGSAQWTEPIAFSTVNGAIRLTLPGKLDADLRAETMNGSIDSDFPITVNGHFGKRRIQGTIGKGGRRLELGTVNGDIVLRSGSS